MVTNYPQQLATANETTENRTADSMIVGRLVGRLGQLLCGMRGHDAILHFERNRVTMRCTSCGHDTPGWEIDGRGPRKRYDGDARRHQMTKQRLVLKKSA